MGLFLYTWFLSSATSPGGPEKPRMKLWNLQTCRGLPILHDFINLSSFLFLQNLNYSEAVANVEILAKRPASTTTLVRISQTGV
jgi:hypothetical protein